MEFKSERVFVPNQELSNCTDSQWREKWHKFGHFTQDKISPDTRIVFTKGSLDAFLDSARAPTRINRYKELRSFASFGEFIHPAFQVDPNAGRRKGMRLPTELHGAIVEFVDGWDGWFRGEALKNLSLVDKELCSLTRPYLFETLSFPNTVEQYLKRTGRDKAGNPLDDKNITEATSSSENKAGEEDDDDWESDEEGIPSAKDEDDDSDDSSVFNSRDKSPVSLKIFFETYPFHLITHVRKLSFHLFPDRGYTEDQMSYYIKLPNILASHGITKNLKTMSFVLEIMETLGVRYGGRRMERDEFKRREFIKKSFNKVLEGIGKDLAGWIEELQLFEGHDGDEEEDQLCKKVCKVILAAQEREERKDKLKIGREQKETTDRGGGGGGGDEEENDGNQKNEGTSTAAAAGTGSSQKKKKNKGKGKNKSKDNTTSMASTSTDQSLTRRPLRDLTFYTLDWTQAHGRFISQIPNLESVTISAQFEPTHADFSDLVPPVKFVPGQSWPNVSGPFPLKHIQLEYEDNEEFSTMISEEGVSLDMLFDMLSASAPSLETFAMLGGYLFHPDDDDDDSDDDDDDDDIGGLPVGFPPAAAAILARGRGGGRGGIRGLGGGHGGRGGRSRGGAPPARPPKPPAWQTDSIPFQQLKKVFLSAARPSGSPEREEDAAPDIEERICRIVATMFAKAPIQAFECVWAMRLISPIRREPGAGLFGPPRRRPKGVLDRIADYVEGKGGKNETGEGWKDLRVILLSKRDMEMVKQRKPLDKESGPTAYQRLVKKGVRFVRSSVD